MHGVQVFSVDAKCVHSLSTRILSGGQAKSKMLMKEAVPSVTKEVIIFANPFDYVKGLSGFTRNRQCKGSVRAFIY